MEQRRLQFKNVCMIAFVLRTRHAHIHGLEKAAPQLSIVLWLVSWILCDRVGIWLPCLLPECTHQTSQVHLQWFSLAGRQACTRQDPNNPATVRPVQCTNHTSLMGLSPQWAILNLYSIHIGMSMSLSSKKSPQLACMFYVYVIQNVYSIPVHNWGFLNRPSSFLERCVDLQ